MSVKIRQAIAWCLGTAVLVQALPSFTPFPPESDHKCYFLDGTFDAAGGPCYGAVGASMCCYSGESCQELTGFCLADPYGTPGPYDNGSSIWRRSCTDVTWQDRACLAVAWELSTQSQQLTVCKDGTFCPRTRGDANTTCCDDANGQVAYLAQDPIPKIVVSNLRASTASTSATSASASSSFSITSTPTSSPTTISTSALTPAPSVVAPTTGSVPSTASTSVPTTTSTDNTGLTEPAKIGIGIGISFGVLLLGLLSLIAFRLRRRSPKDMKTRNTIVSESRGVNNNDMKGIDAADNNVRFFINPMSELSSEAPRREMHTLFNTHELESRRNYRPT